MQDELVSMEKKYDSLVRDLEGAEDALEQERLSYASLQNVWLLVFAKDDSRVVLMMEIMCRRQEMTSQRLKI